MTEPVNISAESELGSAAIPGLLVKLSLPSILGFMSLAICQIIDTLFIGRYIGIHGISALAIVMPAVLLFSSIGRGLGAGGASIISRSIGAGNFTRAQDTFRVLIILFLISTSFLMIAGWLFSTPILQFFGAKGDVFNQSYHYFLLLVPGLPFLGFAMLSNSIIRAEGNAHTAMLIMIIPGVINVLLDPLFILTFNWGMPGAAISSSLAYMAGGCYALHYFIRGKSRLKLSGQTKVLRWSLVNKILSIGITPIFSQVLTVILAIVMNKTLFTFSGEMGLASYAIVQRLYMFIQFPLIGVSQGFIPICGYNYGAGKTLRILTLIKHTIKISVVFSTIITLLLLIFNEHVTSFFTHDPSLANESGFALSMAVLLLPLVGVQLICSGYFQSLGLPLPTLSLTLCRQGLILIPLVLFLPTYLGFKGIWYAYPLSHLLTCTISLLIILPEWRKLGAIAHTR